MELDSETSTKKQRTGISQGTKIIIIISALILIFGLITVIVLALLYTSVSVEISPVWLSLILHDQVSSVRLKKPPKTEDGTK